MSDATTVSPAKPFWEVEHPYSAPESDYFANWAQHQGFHETYDSWEEALPELAGMDEDWNYLYRWDYVAPDPEDYEDEEDEELPEPYLTFCYILQRKGTFYWVKVMNPQAEDEASVRSYLTNKWELVRKTWAPLATSGEQA